MSEIFTLTKDNLTGTYLLKIAIPGRQIQEIICVDDDEVYKYIQDIVIKIEDYLRDVKLSGSKVIADLNTRSKSSTNKRWLDDLKAIHSNKTMLVYAETIGREKKDIIKKYRLYDIDDKVLGEFDNIETAITFFKNRRPQFDETQIAHFIYEIEE
jgi:hypothetical protein